MTACAVRTILPSNLRLGTFICDDDDRHADFHQVAGGSLRHIDPDPHGIVLAHAVKRHGPARAAGGHEIADVDAPLDDRPVVRGSHELELFEGCKLVDVGPIERDLGPRRRETGVAASNPAFLSSRSCSETTPLGALVPARIGGARELSLCLPHLSIRLRRLELRLRGNELCVELRGLDLGQDLPLRTWSPMSTFHFVDIPGYAGVDRTFVPRVRLAWQGQALPARGGQDRDRLDHGRRSREGSRLSGKGARGDEPHCLGQRQRRSGTAKPRQ